MEELKNLIEKINKEGIKTAKARAKEIEDEARKRDREIIAKATSKADLILQKAREEAEAIKRTSNEDLKQAGRNFIISLREEISLMLDRIIVAQVKKELEYTEMARIIAGLIDNYKTLDSSNITVYVSDKDLKGLEEDLMSKLKKEVKKGVVLKKALDIDGGFMISYDDGKSSYDFTDKALAEHIARHVKPLLSNLLQGLDT